VEKVFEELKKLDGVKAGVPVNPTTPDKNTSWRFPIELTDLEKPNSALISFLTDELIQYLRSRQEIASAIVDFADFLTHNHCQFLWRWGQTQALLFFLPQHQARLRKARATLLLDESSIIVIWVDAKHTHNEPMAAEFRAKGTTVVLVNSLPDLQEVLSKHDRKPAPQRAKVRVISNRTRAADGADKAGEQTYAWLRQQAAWKETPFLLFCGNPDLVSIKSSPQQERVLVSKDIRDLQRFGGEKEPF